MPSQVLYLSESRTVQTTHASLDSHLVPGRVVSISESPAFSPVPEELADASPDGLGCVRGIRSAFFLELGGALLVYGAWHL